jgi:hypothetical protein
MPQANPVVPDDGTMDIDRDEGLYGTVSIAAAPWQA